MQQEEGVLLLGVLGDVAAVIHRQVLVDDVRLGGKRGEREIYLHELLVDQRLPHVRRELDDHVAVLRRHHIDDFAIVGDA